MESEGDVKRLKKKGVRGERNQGMEEGNEG